MKKTARVIVSSCPLVWASLYRIDGGWKVLAGVDGGESAVYPNDPARRYCGTYPTVPTCVRDALRDSARRGRLYPANVQEGRGWDYYAAIVCPAETI